MAVSWTAEQKQVIESRNRNLLVSAAAGSGKTAVLVERIIRMITDPDHPLGIDELLVMTFTNAAAAEMRERIGDAIEKCLEKDPDNPHLQAQATLVHRAEITTIDSFCLSLIRSHFNRLDIDPSFRIGDEGELTLLRADVMKEMLEDYYVTGDEDFIRFVETYARGKGDGGLEDLILQVYGFSQSHPWPSLWFKECKKELETAEDGKLEETAWMQFLLEDVRCQALELKEQMECAQDICENDEILSAYSPMLAADMEFLEQLADIKTYDQLNKELTSVSWTRLATIRNKDVNQEQKTFVTSCRDRMKKAVGKLCDLYCFESTEEMCRDLAGTNGVVATLLELAMDFSDRYQTGKAEKNIVDFNDLEHGALKVLIEWVDGEACYTEVADELSRQYGEILIDEYQDSNMVQETLICALSGERFGRPNVFMVGDVKQSIYKFRLAKPELFLKKYENYTTEESSCQKIELHKNFRSREQVLTGINDIFYRIMIKNLGNIKYTEETALHPGAVFEPAAGETGGPVELILVDTGKEQWKALDEDKADYTAREIEARLVAQKIREMTDPECGLLVWDKKKQEYRIAQYRDMVILLRSMAGWTEVFLSVLMGAEIPAYAESRMGYFNTIEVETVLAMLSVLDNPMQDIPLAAALKSPIGNLSDEELAFLMAAYKKEPDKGQDRGIYGACQCYLKKIERKQNEEERAADPLGEKLSAFWKLSRRLRQESSYLPIHQVIYRVFESTGYYDYVSAMPSGDIRRSNLDMLVEKAAAYEKTSYKGLFQFIRYIENLKKFNTDYGEASAVGEEDNTVRIMSIHKSKGLEFPIVFLAGMGKSFNKQDVYGKILIDPDLGIGTDFLDLEQRLKTATLKKNVLRRRMELDNLGEELRVLYVAMTRAKEKLIMTATDRSLEKKLEKFAQVPVVDGQIPYTVLSTAGSCLDWLLMGIRDGLASIEVSQVPIETLVEGELIKQAEWKLSREELLSLETGQIFDEETWREMERMMRYQYPFLPDVTLHTKMSVSELKQQGQMIDEEQTVWLHPEGDESVPLEKPEEQEALPKKKYGGFGASRGTAYHRALELMPFGRISSQREMTEWLNQMVKEHKFSEENRKMVKGADLWSFLTSGLGKRMERAQEMGRLYRERQFVIGIPASEMEVCDSDELVVIQGIIDAYLEEDGELVLVDYKTDQVTAGQEALLAERYQIQLDYYKRALEQMTGKRVKEKILYSVALQKEISI